MYLPTMEGNIAVEAIQRASLGFDFLKATQHRAHMDKPPRMLLTFVVDDSPETERIQGKKKTDFMTIAQSFLPLGGAVTVGHACNKSLKGGMVIHFLRAPYFTGFLNPPSIS